MDKKAFISGAFGAVMTAFALFIIYAACKAISNDLYQRGYDACRYGEVVVKVGK